MSTSYSDAAALLRVILERPEEDTPRLLYADCLEAQGEHKRAAFIRVAFDGSGDDDVWAAFCNADGFRDELARSCGLRVGDIGRSNGIPYTKFRWRAGDDPRAVTHDVFFRFRRGFVETVEGPAAFWLGCADAILDAQPVQRVELKTRTDRAQLIDYLRHRPGTLGSVDAPERTWFSTRELLELMWPGIAFSLPPA